MAFGLGFLKRGSKKEDPRVRQVYDHLVIQARQPVFYQDYQVPDTLSGRFDMIVLHAFLFFQRLKKEDDAARAFGQKVFDTFFDDMDGSLRELGVGYQAVPKRIKKMGEAFYGRIAAYDAAIEEKSVEKLAEALHRNIFTDLDEMPQNASALAAYMMAGFDDLSHRDLANLFDADFSFPDPDMFLAKKPLESNDDV